VQSNCVAVLPLETELGRKRKIDQSACNKDYSCAKGFCPSFVGVLGAQPRKKVGALAGDVDEFLRHLETLPRPTPHSWTGPYDLLVTGVGGTGVVTVGALIAMAAHLEGKSASILDFMGFAQKGGAVLSFVRLADIPSRLNQVRIDAQQADAVLACDVVVAASPDALQTVRRGRTRIVANTHEIPVAESLHNPDATLRQPQLLEKLRFASGAQQLETLDAQALAESFLGDTIASNMVCLGYAWQCGVIPVSLEALLRAIELNGVAVEGNKLALSLGRLAAAEPAALDRWLPPVPDDPQTEALDRLVQHGVSHLTGYQNAAYARRYAEFVGKVRERERQLAADPDLPFTRAVARSLLKLMSYKDEYEVARLYTDGTFMRSLRQQFEGEFALEFHMAPPFLSRSKDGQPPRKIRLGGWLLPAMKLLAHGRVLRGTALDIFGKTEERRLERRLIRDYTQRVESLVPLLNAERLTLATEIAALPLSMRGFGHIKIANVAVARAREAEMLHRLDPVAYPRPTAAPVAGQIRGIAITAGK
jgi:indolepyruvate ferredoxin oxidoreductase